MLKLERQSWSVAYVLRKTSLFVSCPSFLHRVLRISLLEVFGFLMWFALHSFIYLTWSTRNFPAYILFSMLGMMSNCSWKWMLSTIMKTKADYQDHGVSFMWDVNQCHGLKVPSLLFWAAELSVPYMFPKWRFRSNALGHEDHVPPTSFSVQTPAHVVGCWTF
jgi:hypothetical protein